MAGCQTAPLPMCTTLFSTEPAPYSIFKQCTNQSDIQVKLLIFYTFSTELTMIYYSVTLGIFIIH